MSLAKKITCRVCGTEFMDLFYTCPNCHCERESDLKIIEREMYDVDGIFLKSHISSQRFPLEFDTAKNLYNEGKYLYAIREHIKLFSLSNLEALLTNQTPDLCVDFALQWYKALVCSGDLRSALILILQVASGCTGNFTPSNIHAITLISCIIQDGNLTLLEYMKILYDNPNFILPKINISENTNQELLLWIEKIKNHHSEIYQLITQRVDLLPKI